MAKDLGSFIQKLRAAGELVEVPVAVAPRFQAAALLEQAGLGLGPAVYLADVAGYPGFAMAGNLLGTTGRMAMALDAPPHQLQSVFRQRRDRRIPPVRVADGPVREITVTGNPDVLAHLPVLTHYEGDAGPYVTAGAVIAREPGGEKLGMGIHRVQVKGPDRLGVLLLSPPIGTFLKEAEAHGESLEVAIVIGGPPALTLAAAARTPDLTEKLALAGSLLGEPLELVDGVTVQVPVPAQAEFIIEGRVLPGVRELDGPFGESTGTYLPFQSPVVQVTGISRRRAPIYPALLPWGAEVDLIMDITVGGQLMARLRELAPCVQDVRLSLGTCGMQAVLQVRPSSRADVRQALHLALTIDNHVKTAIAVDQDVDPASSREVAWAMATRMQPDQDLMILSGLPGYSIDPSAAGGTTARVGIDATLRPEECDRWRRIRVPETDRAWARDVWQRSAGREWRSCGS